MSLSLQTKGKGLGSLKKTSFNSTSSPTTLVKKKKNGVLIKRSGRTLRAEVVRRRGRLSLAEYVPETKFLDVYPNGTLSTAPTISYLGIMAQGDGDGTRDGDDVEFVGMSVRWFFTYADTTNIFRFIIFRDVSSNGVTPIEAEVLETPSNPLSSINSVNVKRFIVLYDHLTAVTSAGDACKTGVVHLKKRFNMNYIGTTAASSSAGTNSLYVLLMSDSGAATHPSYGFMSRVYYKDV